jgi:hypothetical protein
MGFGSFIGGILLGILSVVLAFFGIVVLLGFITFLPSNFDVPLGIVMIIAALFLFAFGWYSYQSSKPKGTINVHNQ